MKDKIKKVAGYVGGVVVDVGIGSGLVLGNVATILGVKTRNVKLVIVGTTASCACTYAFTKRIISGEPNLIDDLENDI